MNIYNSLLNLNCPFPVKRRMIILDCRLSLCTNMSDILHLYLKLDYGRRRGHTIELQIPSTY